MGPVTPYPDNTSTMALGQTGSRAHPSHRHQVFLGSGPSGERTGRDRLPGNGRDVRERTDKAAARSAVRLRETVPHLMDR